MFRIFFFYQIPFNTTNVVYCHATANLQREGIGLERYAIIALEYEVEWTIAENRYDM